MIIPPKYSITSEMIELLGKIEVIRQYIKTINIPLHIKQKIQRVSLLKSSLYSAKIEGNPLTIDDFKNSPDKIKRLEIDNIYKAIKYILKLKIRSVKQETIKTIHKISMNNINYQAGQFRTEMSAIFNQAGVAIYVCPPPNEINQLIDKLTTYINLNDKEFPLIKGFLTHLIFEKIHPFLDGNGRVGRLMIPLICKLNNYEFDIFVSFEEYINENKNDYYYNLDGGLKNPNEYILFMLKAFYSQTNKLKNQIESEISSKNIINLPLRQEEIYNIIKDHNSVSLNFIKRRFLKVPTRTLRYDLKKLTNKKLIVKIGKTKGSYYKIV